MFVVRRKSQKSTVAETGKSDRISGRSDDDDDDDDERLTCPKMTESLLRHDKMTVRESSAERDESSDDCRT